VKAHAVHAAYISSGIIAANIRAWEGLPPAAAFPLLPSAPQGQPLSSTSPAQAAAQLLLAAC